MPLGDNLEVQQKLVKNYLQDYGPTERSKLISAVSQTHKMNYYVISYVVQELLAKQVLKEQNNKVGLG